MGDIFPEEKGDESGGKRWRMAGDELTAALHAACNQDIGIGMTHFNISSKEFLSNHSTNEMILWVSV